MNYMNSHDNGATRKLWVLLRQLRVLRIIHIIALAAIPVYVSIIFERQVLYGSATIFNSNVTFLHIIEVSLGLIAIMNLLLGYYWPRLSRKTKTAKKPEILVAFNHISRIALFEAVAVYGLILAILGSSWYIWVPFFLLSGVALILTFPTEERWNRWMENRSKS